MEIKTNDPDSINYSTKFLRVNTMIVTKEFLKSSSFPDSESVIISSEDYINESKNLTQYQIDNIMFPEVYHFYNRNSNTGMKSYRISVLKQILD